VAMITTCVLFFAAMCDIASAVKGTFKLAHTDKNCDPDQREAFLPSNGKKADVAACQSECASAPSCRSVSYYSNGFCALYATRCKKTKASLGTKSYTIVEDPVPSIVGSKHLGEKCSEGAMTHAGYVFNIDFCVDICGQTAGCHSITHASDGYCYLFTSDCKKRNSLSGAVSFQVKQFTTRAVYDFTDCTECKKGSQFIPQTSGYVLTLEDCLNSCSRNADCEGTVFYYDGFCSHFGTATKKDNEKAKMVCYKKKPKENECMKNNGGCDSKRKCTHHWNDGMKCEDCPAGYENDGAKGCKDVDECAKNNGGCDSKRKCTNSVGSFKCEDCPAGYENDGAKGCKDVDECAKNNGGCDSKRKCTNSVGSFKCEDCPAGYENDGAKGCKDVDECAKNNGGCHSKRKCTNSAGSFKCEKCQDGYVNDGAKNCKRQNPCQKDLHACDGDRGGCHVKRTCAETNGGKDTYCKTCPAGYVNDGPKGCTEITGTLESVCNDQRAELWLRQIKVVDYAACLKTCMDHQDCVSITFYSKQPKGFYGCDHWSTMCKSLKPADGAISKNLKGEALNKKECDVGQGETFLEGLERGSTKNIKECSEACEKHGECNAFVYYNHGSCSFFSSCCEHVKVSIDNAHTMRWRIPEP